MCCIQHKRSQLRLWEREKGGGGGGKGMLVCAGGGEGREWDKTLGPSIIAFSTLTA